jgi:hypothetical protein
MSKAKDLFFFVILAGIGAILVVGGFKEFRNSKRLIAEGKSTVGNVVDSEERRGRRGRRSCYLTVAFQTAEQQAVTRKVRVSRSVYNGGTQAGTVKVHYLSSNPSVCQFGEKVAVKYGTMVWGFLALGGSSFLLIGFFRAVKGAASSDGVIASIPAKPAPATQPEEQAKAA